MLCSKSSLKSENYLEKNPKTLSDLPLILYRTDYFYLCVTDIWIKSTVEHKSLMMLSLVIVTQHSYFFQYLFTLFCWVVYIF